MAIIEHTDFLVERFLGLNVVVGESDDFLADLVRRFGRMRSCLALASAFITCPNVSVLCLLLLILTVHLLLSSSHTAMCGFIPHACVLDGVHLLATLALLSNLPVLVCRRQLRLR